MTVEEFFDHVITVRMREDRSSLDIIDQTLLPGTIKRINLNTKEEIWEAIKKLRVRGAPAIGAAAAYTHGEEWLEQVLGYVQANIDFTENYLKEHVPGIGMIRPQASYLVFLDCRALGLPQEKLARLFAEKAHLALNDGTMFGKPGEGFMRLNVGCPRSVLQKALEQLSAAVKEEMAKG